MAVKLEPFVEKVSDYIELPTAAELLVMPTFNRVSPEDLRKYGTDFQKGLLDKVPFRHDTQYISIYCTLQFLYPEIRSNLLYLGGTVENEWHIDRDKDRKLNNTWHLLMNDCTALTQFTEKAIEIEDEIYHDPESKVLIRALNTPGKYDIVPKPALPNRIHTFNHQHLHRAETAKKPEFRFFFRVMETDFLPAYSIDRAMGHSIVWLPDGTAVSSIRRTPDGISLRYDWK